jgi:hypothetical protein
MNKLLAVLTLLVCATGCAETTNDGGRLMMADMDHGPAVAADGPAPRAAVTERAVASRDGFDSRPARAEILHCAQCR